MEMPKGWTKWNDSIDIVRNSPHASWLKDYLDEQKFFATLIKEMAETLDAISKMDWLDSCSYHPKMEAEKVLKRFHEMKWPIKYENA